MIKDVLQDVFKSLPKMILGRVLAQKLEDAKVEIPPEAFHALVDHVLTGQKDHFVWVDGVDSEIKNVILEFTEKDSNDIEIAVNKAIKSLPEIVLLAIDQASKLLFNRLKKNWDDEHLAQQYEVQMFREGMEARWGDGLDYLRMLLTCCREIGTQTVKRHSKSKSKRHAFRRWVLVRLHARACQVADEIICLMENGFAEGAMARWRTLHELSVVATLIADGDEDLAERYILHDAVEVKRQADEYEAAQVGLGATPIGKRERKAIDREYEVVLKKYGNAFSHPYGWAASHMNLKKPTFKDLQSAADHAGMNSYYKLASFGVHASARSLFFNLSAIGDQEVLLAGRCNGGLEEPGRRTAYSLALITSLYAGSSPDIDRISIQKCLLHVRDAVGPALQKAANRLRRDEVALRKNGGT